MSTSPLVAEAFEAVCQLRAALSLVSKLSDEKRERLGVAGDPERARIHRLEANVADQRGGHFLSARVVAAIHEAGPVRLGPRYSR